MDVVSDVERGYVDGLNGRCSASDGYWVALWSWESTEMKTSNFPMYRYCTTRRRL